jgi:hypothetical protein
MFPARVGMHPHTAMDYTQLYTQKRKRDAEPAQHAQSGTQNLVAQNLELLPHLKHAELCAGTRTRAQAQAHAMVCAADPMRRSSTCASSRRGGWRPARRRSATT